MRMRNARTQFSEDTRLPYRVKSISPKGGPAIELNKLTVLVGPNNCGKSQTLKDIREYTTSGRVERLIVLGAISATLPSEDELRDSVRIREHENAADHLNITGVKDDLMSQVSFGPHKTWFGQVFSDGSVQADRERQVLESLGTCLIAYLGAEARFSLTKSSSAINPRSEVPSNALQSLHAADSNVLAELRRAFRLAFQMDIGLDWAAMTRLYLRVSEDFGAIPDTRSDLDALMSCAPELEGQGDGFRSFAGIALALLTYPNRPLLLDEPEAFLHPAQARMLGRWIAEQASKRAGQIIVATHSADFLAGLVSSAPTATILRLNRSSEATLFHVIPEEVTNALVDSPLLSSQSVVDSLFHRGVAICEGDPDRAVYQTVAQRIIQGQFGEDFLFIHCNGKDAAKFPAELLRKSGTPVCVVADFDVLNSEDIIDGIVTGLTGDGLGEDEKRARDTVAAAIETKAQKLSLAELRESVTEWLEKSEADLRRARKDLVSSARAGSNKWDRAKKLGIASLKEEDKPAAQALLKHLMTRGLFVVPCGELESWLDLGVPKGNKWNRKALHALYDGACPHELTQFVEHILGFLRQSKAS